MNLLRFLLISSLFMGGGLYFSMAQVNTLSGVGGSGSLYNRGPYTTLDLSEDEGIGDRESFRVGDITLRPRIELVAVKEDNIFLSDEGQTDDVYMVLLPGVLAIYGDPKRNHAYIDFTIDVPFGLDADSEDVDNLQMTVLGHYVKSKLTFDASYTYRDLRSGDIVIGNRVTKEEHVFYGGYGYAMNSKTEVGVNASYSQQDFSSTDFTDYSDVKLSARLSWKAFDKSRLFGQFSAGEVDVDGRVGAFGDADYLEGSFGLDSQLNSRWHAVGTVGYQIREFDREDIEEVEGITSSVRLNGNLFDHIHAGISFWSLIRPAANEAGATLTETRLEPTVSRRIWIDELVASVSVVFGWVDYEGPDNQSTVGEVETPLVFNGREDTYQGYTLGLDWQVFHQFSLGIGYSYIENDTNSSVGDESTSYDAERWMLRAQYNF